MGRVEYWNDPAAPKPNSLVPACGVLAADDVGRVLLQRRRRRLTHRDQLFAESSAVSSGTWMLGTLRAFTTMTVCVPTAAPGLNGGE